MKKCGPSLGKCQLCGGLYSINPPRSCGCNKSNIQKNRNIKIDTIIGPLVEEEPKKDS